MVARYKIFGSDELSAHSPAIAELVEPGFIEISDDDARTLGVIEGDGLVLSKPETTSQGDMLTVPIATLEVRLNSSLAKGCAGYSVGLEGAQNIVCGDSLAMVKADNWQRQKPQIIGSDGGRDV